MILGSPFTFSNADHLEETFNVQSALQAAAQYINFDSLSAMFYNTCTQILKLFGPTEDVESVKRGLQGIMDRFSKNPGMALLPSVKTKFLKPMNEFRTPPAPSDNASTSDSNAREELTKLFTIRAFEDGPLIQAWEQEIMPALPVILDEAFGLDYTVSLVRQGKREKDASPVIRIQSPYPPAQDHLESVEKDIISVCRKHGFPSVSVQFSRGQMRMLVDNSDNTRMEQVPFNNHVRFWRSPGIGASIGLKCTKRVAGTFGGYILVDNKLYGLIADHIVKDSLCDADPNSIGAHGTNQVISPSRMDILDLTRTLEQTMRDQKMRAGRESKRLGAVDLPFDQVKEWLFSTDLPAELQSLAQLCYENDRDEVELDFGTVAYRRQLKIRKPTSEIATGSLGGPNPDHNYHWMDWALIEIKNERQGQNSSRYNRDGKFATHFESLGEGDFCEEVCEVRPNTKVHYYGRKKGLRRGVVNGARTLVSNEDGTKTLEWAMMCEEMSTNGDEFKGDSGAWVLEDDTNHVLGMLSAVCNGQLIFNPMTTIFAGIKEELKATEVRLPGRRIPAPAPVATNQPSGPAVTRITEIKDPSEEPSKTYILESLPLLLPLPLSYRSDPFDVDDSPAKAKLDLKRPQLQQKLLPLNASMRPPTSTEEDEPQSPVPSLSQASSTTTDGQQSPCPSQQNSGRRRSSLLEASTPTRDAHSPRIRMLENGEEDRNDAMLSRTPSRPDDVPEPERVLHEPSPQRENEAHQLAEKMEEWTRSLKKFNKCSVPYLCGDDESPPGQIKKALTLPIDAIPPLVPPPLKRKRPTFPIETLPTKLRTLTCDVTVRTHMPVTLQA